MRFCSRWILPLIATVLSCNSIWIQSQTNAQSYRNTIIPSEAFSSRQDIFVSTCATRNEVTREGFFNSICRVKLGQALNETIIDEELKRVNSRTGPHQTTFDFRINNLLRILYLNRQTQILSITLQQKIQETVLNFRYWLTDAPIVEDQNIFWTENHLLMYRTIEYLAGLMFPDERFSVAGLTGSQHADRAEPALINWLDQRGKFGFAEWQSNPYTSILISPLVNLVDFAPSLEISTKAAMLLDIIGFNMANNYFNGLYATSMGRTGDRRRVTTIPRFFEQESNCAYLMLGLEGITLRNQTDMGSIAVATSDNYVPPPILENIARSASDYHEHWERNSIFVDQGDLYDIKYDAMNVNDLTFWWSMSAPLVGPVVEATTALIRQYNLPAELIFGDPQLLSVLQAGASVKGVSLSEYCSGDAAYLVRGPALETSNLYTYRTPDYQLSGTQDHNKGWASLEKLIWQATLDTTTYVFTSSPSPVSEEFVGGWMPRATIYRNVGVFQYDRHPGDSFLDTILSSSLEQKDYTHAYFPRSQFETWNEVKSDMGTFLFGKKGNGYLALFSSMDGNWESDWEWRVLANKTAFLVELGSLEESGSYEQFQQTVLSSSIVIASQPGVGFSISYQSPSVGLIEVGWEGPMLVGGRAIDLGPYPRYNNKFCKQEFGSSITRIVLDDRTLCLDFSEMGERRYGPSVNDPETVDDIDHDLNNSTPANDVDHGTSKARLRDIFTIAWYLSAAVITQTHV